MKDRTADKKRGLRWQFTIYFLALIILPLLITGSVIAWQMYEAFFTGTLELQRSYSQLAQSRIKDHFDRLQNELRTIVTEQNLGRMTGQEQQKVIVNLLGQYRSFLKFAMFDPQGRRLFVVTWPSRVSPEGDLTIPDDPIFQSVLETRLKKVSAIQFFGDPPRPYVAVYHPIIDASTSQVTRVMVIWIGFQMADQIIAETRFGDEGYAYLTDAQGRLLAYPDSSKLSIGTAVGLHETSRVQQGLNGKLSIVSSSAVQLEQNLMHVVTEIPVSETYEFATRILWIIGALFLITLISAAVFRFNLTRKVLRPVETLHHAAMAVHKGDLSQRVKIAGSNQLEGLGSAFNAMVSRLEEMLKAHRQRSDELEKLNKELERFAYIASHDLQEPLRKIQAFGERLESRSGDALDDKSLYYLERMRDSAHRLQNLVNDLLTYSRVSTRDEERVSVDLGTIIKNVLSDLEVQMERTGGRVEVGKLPTIEANPTLMQLLFQNLISNGLKFHREGVPPEVRITSERKRDHPLGTVMHEIRVADNGIGFNHNDGERMFEVFQRLHGRSEYEGTGIGLAICKKIVERHGGWISAHGKPDEGATIVVSLPEKQIQLNETRDYAEAH